MIDEKKLIDELKQSGMIVDNEYGNAIVDMVGSQPKIGGWIPCSERLPEKGGTYFVTAVENELYHTTFVKWQKRHKKWDLTGARAYWRITAWQPLPEPYGQERKPEAENRKEAKREALKKLQVLHEIEQTMSREEEKQVMIEHAVNLRLMCDYVVSCSHQDVVLIICMLHDYVKMLDECREDVVYRVYYRKKFMEMADRLAEQIEYDYDEAVEKCMKKMQRQEVDSDVGGDAMALAMKYGAKGKGGRE